jgi:hypothetical protein
MIPMTPKYKPGDVVKIVEEPWSEYAGVLVTITKAEVVNFNGREFVTYEWVIPEQRGMAPERYMGDFITHIPQNNKENI